MKCPFCNQEHPSNTKFCPETGNKIEQSSLTCSSCGFTGIPADSKFCPNCGHPFEKIEGEEFGVSFCPKCDSENVTDDGSGYLQYRCKSCGNTWGHCHEECPECGSTDVEDDGYGYLQYECNDCGHIWGDDNDDDDATDNKYDDNDETPCRPESQSLSPSRIIDNINMDMIYIEGGTFMMGATTEQGEDSWDNEKPTHQVIVSSYHICKHPVTIREWEAVMGKSKYITSEPCHPVHNVTWNDCHQFIERLNSLTGKNYRLPREAEWEFAARGGNNSMGYKYSGSDNIDDVANYSQNGRCWYDRYYNMCNVMHKQPNELGIFDMSGNVWEWCEDWYGDYSNECQINPIGPSKGEYRVIRGGGADSRPGRCRVSSRDLKSEDSYGIGFRLVY